MSDLAASIAGVLEDARHKPPRVQAKLVAEMIRHHGLQHETILSTPMEDRPEPATWLAFAERLVEDGVATTRNRTHAAMRALGLDPYEVRAVVIEHDYLRIYRWTDRASAQTMPIMGGR